MTVTPRRPLRSRQTRWAAALAGWLTRAGVRPNAISALSVVFAGLAGLCLIGAASGGTGRRIVLLLATAGFIQLRLLCNLLDGMVAIATISASSGRTSSWCRSTSRTSTASCPRGRSCRFPS